MTYKICEWDSFLSAQIERDATPEEAAEIEARKAAALVPVVPEEVPARGLRRALYKADQLLDVEAWIAGAEGEQADLIRIDWAAAQSVQRGDLLLEAYKAEFNKTDAEVDALLIAAASA